MVRLRVEEEGAVRELLLQGLAVIGRAEECAIHVDEPRSSREHAEVVPVAGGVLVTDLGSTNGTWRDEERLLRATVRPGERFRIGATWFEVVPTGSPPARTGREVRPGAVLGALAPAAILLLLVFIGIGALRANRDGEIAGARDRLALAEYRLASGTADEAERLAALEKYEGSFAGTTWAKRAEEEIANLAPRIARRAVARDALAELEVLREQDALAFSELRYRYERLLDRYSDLPGTAEAIRASVHRLYADHDEALGRMVADVQTEARRLAAAGEYGRAATLLTSFVMRNPVAASTREAELRDAEAAVMTEALHAYRDLISRADGLARDGDREAAAELLREQAATFNGTRFMAFLRLRADSVSGRRSSGADAAGEEDLLVLRRSYYLLAREAEELAAAGLFGPAAGKYRDILANVKLTAIRDEFARREAELRGLAGLMERLKSGLTSDPARFGVVRLAGARFRVAGFSDGVLELTLGEKTLTRPFSSLAPEEVLALLRAARLPVEDRLLVAAWCFDVNLREEFREEILGLLEIETAREAAGRLYATKEGRAYPEGGFVSYKARILTRTDYAEEIHREQVAKLRDRQTTLFTKLTAQPVFEKKLAKLAELRLKLDETREFALALIFDEVKYFYPYRERMAEYTIVQKEVDRRVAAVREVWDDPLKVVLKVDSGVKSILAEIDETNAALHELSVDTSEFDRRVRALTRYLDLTLTIRDYFVDPGEAARFEYNRRVMEYNAAVESVARDPERRQIEVTNEYRMMMGRRALVLDDRLVRTARGHCDEMSRLGYFSHFSPNPERRTPDLRAKIEGYTASAVSENIHAGRGDPEGAHNSWLHSSGHHRNILQSFWTDMGAGQAGRYWTQNFGRTKPKDFAGETEK